ncbi:MAG: ABC transporter substrate-binding protein [Pseudomonadota bacterium]
MNFQIKALSIAAAIAVSSTLAPAALAARTDITVGAQLEPPNLDPTSGAAGAIDQVTYANIFEGLTRFGRDGSINPGLAESWTVSEDGKEYTFNLRQGVKFHDGSDMTADDVKFSLERIGTDESTNAQKALYEDIASIEVIDPNTVKVILSEPNGSMLFNLAWGDAVIVSPETAATNATNPIGTGAFRFVDWVQGDRVEMERNPDYWGEPAKLENVTFKFISDPTAAFAAVMAGDVDTFMPFPAPENLPQFEADPRFRVLTGSTEGETILSTNNEMPPFDNPKVREALAHAIDRKAIIDGAMFGFGTPIGTHFAPHHPSYIDLTAQSDYDPDKARALLSEAGFPDGFTTTLKLPPPVYARRGGEIIAAQLRDVGIETEITNLEWAQWLEQVFRGKDFGLTIVAHTEPLDIGIYARPDYYFQYDSPEFQKIIEDLNNTTDTAERDMLLKAAQRKIADDFVNGYLFQLANTGVINAKLQGVWENAPTQAADMTGVFWED